MSGARSTDLLANLAPITVLGNGQVARTAAEILGVLGATVSMQPKAITADHVRDFEDQPLVIADVVGSGVVPEYAAAVAARSEGVWVTISAFGLDGPLGGHPGSDLVCAAAGGLLQAVCDTSGRMYALPNNQALQLAGQAAVLAALHGLSLSERDSKPVHLDLSAQEAVAFSSVQQECAHLLYRCGGSGGSRRYKAPSGVFRCKDGQIGLIVIDDHQWQRFCTVLVEPDWAKLYPLISDRQAHEDEIYLRTEQWCAGHLKVDAERVLQAAGLAAVAIRSPRELQFSEQFRYRGFLRPMSHGFLRTELLPAEVTPVTDSACRSRSRRALQHMRVAEVTNVLAGPLAGAILGAMGAEVVRVEEAERLDVYRRNGPFVDGQVGVERAAYFLFANYCKRSASRRVGVDGGSGDELVGWAHLVLENVGSARLDRLGIVVQPDDDHSVISISGFGRSGPCAEYRAYAPNVHTYAGLTGAVQEGASDDITIWSSIADYAAAVWAATVAVAWWIGGTSGRRCDLSMVEVMAAKLNGLAIDGPPVDKDTYDVLIRCDKDYVAVTATEQEYAELLGTFPVQASPPKVPSEATTVLLPAEARSITGPLLAAALGAAGFRASLVHGSAEVLADRQLEARGFVVDLPHPEVGRAPIFALPWKLAGELRSGYRRAPLLGEDDDWLDSQLAEYLSGSR